MISSLGVIKNTKTGRSLKLHPDKDGYFRVGLYTGTKQVTRIVHRLLGQHFIKNPENKPLINHKNGIKTDNSLSNLEWVTDLENKKHAWANNLMNPRPGIRHHNCKLTENDIKEIKKMVKSQIKRRIIAKKFNISKGHVYRIVKGIRWGHLA